MRRIIIACTIIVYFISTCGAIINVNDVLGSTISLECPHSENDQITWKGPYLGNAVYASKYGINKNLPEELHSRLFVINASKTKTFLRIVNVQISDEGLYECSTGGSRSIETFNLQLPGLLSSNDPTYNRFLLIDPDLNKLIVGQMNSIALIYLHERPVFPVQMTTINFPPDVDKLDYCKLQKSEVPFCQNHIRFVTKKTDDTFILCGTNAKSPTGYVFNITDNSRIETGDVPSSDDPSDNFTAIYTTSNNPKNEALMYYGATKNGESTISRPAGGSVLDSMKGVISNKWMKEPQFVGSFDVNDRVLFFFRETAIEEEPFETKIYSRVAKVCKEDVGGAAKLRNKWTGYQKAKLGCYIPGDFPIHFDMLQDVVSTDNTIFYGLFTSGVGSPASAICAFNVSEIERVFNDAFKEPRVDSLYYWEEKTTPLTPRPGTCTNDSLSTPDDVLTFINEHPLMHETVQPMHGKPVFVLDDVELQQLELHGNTSVVIFYVASNTGKVYKLLLKDNTTYSLSTYSPLNNSDVIWSMKQHGEYLYVGTDYTVQRINIMNCEQYRWIDSCVRDPHCVWVNATEHLSDVSTESDVKCYNRCRSLRFVEEKGLTNNPYVYSHNNYNLSATTAYRCCPTKPTHVQVAGIEQTKVTLRWIAGFNGGYDQVFTIDYKRENDASWVSKDFDYTGEDIDPHIFDLQGLLPSCLYNIRIYAKNEIGSSTKTFPIDVFTISEASGLSQNDQKDSKVAETILGILLAVSVIVNVLLLVRIIFKYNGKHQQTNKVEAQYMTNGDKTNKDLSVGEIPKEVHKNRSLKTPATLFLCIRCRGEYPETGYQDERTQKDMNKNRKKKKRKKKKENGDSSIQSNTEL